MSNSVVPKVLTLLRSHAVAFAALFLLIGGSAYAAIDEATSAQTPKKTVYACVTQTHQTLNLTSAARTCPNGQRKISWNAAGRRGARGAAGKPGAQGATGAVGATGAAGPKGDAGSPGPRGLQGEPGATGADGDTGPQGPAGPTGPQGPAGASAFAEFFALMPPDNAATVAPGTDVGFPQDGPLIGTGEIARTGPSSFNLSSIGVYRVAFQVPVTEAGQLILTLNGADLAYTVTGRATGTSQIVGEALVETTSVDSVMTLRNPAGNSTALTITPLAGGTRPVSATLIIERLTAD